MWEHLEPQCWDVSLIVTLMLLTRWSCTGILFVFTRYPTCAPCFSKPLLWKFLFHSGRTQYVLILISITHCLPNINFRGFYLGLKLQNCSGFCLTRITSPTIWLVSFVFTVREGVANVRFGNTLAWTSALELLVLRSTITQSCLYQRRNKLLEYLIKCILDEAVWASYEQTGKI